MTFAYNDQLKSDRISRLQQARQSLAEYREKAVVDLAARKAKLDLLNEDWESLAAPETNRWQAMGAAFAEEARLTALASEKLGRLERLLPKGRNLVAKTESARAASVQFAQALPANLVRIRKEAREQARRNSMFNVDKRRILGTLPRKIEMMDYALEAVVKGDPAVCTCLVRGQVDRALRVADVWMSRKMGNLVTSSDLGEYMTAYAERDTAYEVHERQARDFELARAREEMVGKAINELRLRNILKELEGGREVKIVDADWEEVSLAKPLMLQDGQGHATTP